MPSLYDMRQAEAAGSLGGLPAAGKATSNINASFSAFDYGPAKLNPHRSFLMDDYLTAGRASRAHAPASRGASWDVMQYQKDIVPFQPKQGFSETKFHAGFMRRQASAMPYLQQREEKLLSSAATEERPGRRPMHSGKSYNVLTGEGMDPSMDHVHGQRRHLEDPRELRQSSMHADAPGGRLRDSTSRFFCTPSEMPRRPARQERLEADGLTVTKRTSTVIGVGANPSQEIFSIGAREVLSDSLYGLQRRNRG